MACLNFLESRSFVHRLDPRGRIIVAVAYSCLLAVSQQLPVILAGVGLALLLLFLARLPWRPVLQRLTGLNVFMLLLFALLPFTTPGEPLFSWGRLGYSTEGLRLAVMIALKGNAILLFLTVLISTIEVTNLGHALNHLHVPDKLVHLFLFTIRYIEVLHQEMLRLLRAMRVRCFQPGMTRHTYKTLGNLVGMLLVRSMDRSDRILAAMKCRNFNGKFYLMHHFHASGIDTIFGCVAAAVFLALVWVQFT